MTWPTYAPGPWFPIFNRQLDDAGFKALTPAEKVMYWYLASEFNSLGQFYRADVDLAAAVKLSVAKVRQARRKFQRLGWLAVVPGF